MRDFPPMHPVTRLGRVIQQLTSFGDLHADELERMAQELEASDATEVAARLRLYRDVQRDEGQIVIDELVDIQAEVFATAAHPEPSVAPDSATPAAASDRRFDPAINSPKRAKWLAEQAAEAERLKALISRRHFLNRAAPKAAEPADKLAYQPAWKRLT